MVHCLLCKVESLEIIDRLFPDFDSTEMGRNDNIILDEDAILYKDDGDWYLQLVVDEETFQAANQIEAEMN